MAKKKNRAKNIKANKIILLAILGALVGLTTIYYKFSQKNISQDTNFQASTQLESIGEEKIDTSNKIPVNLGNGYVGIEEMGIKFKLPSELEGLIYSTFNESKGVSLSTQKLSDMDPACTAQFYALGGLIKMYKKDLREEQEYPWIYNKNELEKYTNVTYLNGQTVKPRVKEFETFYIIYDAPGAVCSENDSVVDAQLELEKYVQDIIPLVEEI